MDGKNNDKVSNSNSKKCFVMMPFSDIADYEPNHFQKVYEQIIAPSITTAGFEPIRVDQNMLSDQIIVKIIDYIVNCDMAICDLSSNNPNVLYELGMRHAFDKPVVLINDDKTKRIFDIQGITIISYRSSRLYDEVVDDRQKIVDAIEANEKNKSGYSLMNLLKLSKASFDANGSSEDPTAIQSAMLQRIISMLENNKSNSVAIDDDIYTAKNEMNSKMTEKIVCKTGNLCNLVSAAESHDLCLNIPSTKYEIEELINDTTQFMHSKFTSPKDYETLRFQKNILKNLYLKLSKMEANE